MPADGALVALLWPPNGSPNGSPNGPLNGPFDGPLNGPLDGPPNGSLERQGAAPAGGSS